MTTKNEKGMEVRGKHLNQLHHPCSLPHVSAGLCLGRVALRTYSTIRKNPCKSTWLWWVKGQDGRISSLQILHRRQLCIWFHFLLNLVLSFWHGSKIMSEQGTISFFLQRMWVQTLPQPQSQPPQPIFVQLFFCISVSAKGFYKSQSVIDFLCEILNMRPNDLDNKRLEIDRQKFEKAIRGIVLL